MFKHYLEGIKNIEIGPIISLNLFFVVIVWIFRLDKGFINKMKNLPLEEDKPENNINIEE